MLTYDRLLKAAAIASLLGLAALVLGGRPAKAQASLHTHSCQVSLGRVICQSRYIPGGWAKPNVQYVPRLTPGSPEAQAQEARVADWERRCVTGFRYDNEGVKYYVYASEACSHGN